MILNGKALEDFEKWYFKNHCSSNIKFEDLLPHHIYDVFGWLYKQSLTIQNALIIEFFDEQNIYIDIRIEFNDSFVLKTFDSYVDSDYVGNYSKRQEATIQAIIKADKIYNERFK